VESPTALHDALGADQSPNGRPVFMPSHTSIAIHRSCDASESHGKFRWAFKLYSLELRVPANKSAFFFEKLVQAR